jgi:two-component system phosphate regulon sensor histidine kinase PhoR
MPSQRLLPPRFLKGFAIASAPIAVALIGLIGGGWLAPLPAFAAGGASLAGLAWLLLLHLRRLDAIAGYLDRLTRGVDETAAVPPPAGAAAGITGDLHRAVTDAGRLWSARRRELEAVVAANEAVLASLPDPLLMLDRGRRRAFPRQRTDRRVHAPGPGRTQLRRARRTAAAADRRRDGRPAVVA